MSKTRPRTWEKTELGRKWLIEYVANWKKRNPEKALQYQRIWRKRHLEKTRKQAESIFMKAHNKRLDAYRRVGKLTNLKEVCQKK